jgi:hypothetical protein
MTSHLRVSGLIHALQLVLELVVFGSSCPETDLQFVDTAEQTLGLTGRRCGGRGLPGR